ncbi:MAG: SpoIID/LytB domain-containing protein [Thermoanaerobacteraceae bacterium]|nr:SpoIID/LytB domain-containing protein [Thermoanaerobacteraceae bacterium]
MYKRTVINLLTAGIIVMFMLVAVGCPNQARKPGPPGEGKKPRIPGGKEPTITLYVNETGEKKEIKMEEYLQGVVAAEMDTSWPEEALAAQAILARTFTMKKIQEGGVPQYGTDASTDKDEFQAYDPSKINDRVRKAAERTRGKVITYKGNYINAWFFADGGGKTAALPQEGLVNEKPVPYIKSVKDPGFAITEPENKSWTAEFPLSQVRQAVKQQTGQDPAAVSSAKIVEKGPSGRALTLQIGNVKISGPKLRQALGSDKMRSTLLDRFEVSGNKLIIGGRGYGHGVGMSQWGARALAEQGKSAEEIVNYFFKDVKIQKVWD